MMRSMTCVSMCAAAAFGLSLGSPRAEAVTVTVTSGPNAGQVVFDSGGFEAETAGNGPSAAAPAGASWTGNTNGNNTVLTGATVGGPGFALQGDQYLRSDRTSVSAVVNAQFSRDLNPQQESFEIEFAMWMNDPAVDATYPQAYFFIQADSVGTGSPAYATMLAGFGMRHDANGSPELMKYRISGSNPNYGASTTSVPAPPSWTPAAWNAVLFEWDHVAAKAWLTVDDQSALDVTFAFSNGAYPASYQVPTSMGQFQIRANNTDSVVFVDSVPEPTSLGLLGLGGVLLMGRRRWLKLA